MTVGFGVSPNLLSSSGKTQKSARGLRATVAHTAGGDFHPAPRTCLANRQDADVLVVWSVGVDQFRETLPNLVVAPDQALARLQVRWKAPWRRLRGCT
jgi:hypothetical protein